MIDILKKITKRRLERNWAEYELAKYSGLTQSTISTWYRKNQVPTLPTLEKVCNGLGITLSQFFAEGEDLICLTPEQKKMLDNWSTLTTSQQEIIMNLIENM